MDPADAQDGALGKIDDRRKGVDAEAPQVGHGEGATRLLEAVELALPRPLGELLRLDRDCFRPNDGTSRTTGTSSPASVSTAIPM